MKKIIVLSFLICICCVVSAQFYDLVVTSHGDSIACRILNMNDSVVIFNMKDANNTIQLTRNRSKVKEIKHNVVQKGMYRFKPGTSLIVGKEFTTIPGTIYSISSETYKLENLQNASVEELKYYRYKANKLQKSGKTITTVGGVTVGASLLTALIVDWGMAEVLLGFPAMAGLGTMAVGIPMNLTGKKRVERINSIKNTASNDVRFNLQPCTQYNLAMQNYQPGVSLRISF